MSLKYERTNLVKRQSWMVQKGRSAHHQNGGRKKDELESGRGAARSTKDPFQLKDAARIIQLSLRRSKLVKNVL